MDWGWTGVGRLGWTGEGGLGRGVCLELGQMGADLGTSLEVAH